MCDWFRKFGSRWGGLREDLIGVTFNGGPRLVDAVGAAGRRKIELIKLGSLK